MDRNEHWSSLDVIMHDEIAINMAAPQYEVAYVSVKNQAKRSSSRTSYKYVYISMRSFKGCNRVRLKVYEKRIKAQDPG